MRVGSSSVGARATGFLSVARGDKLLSRWRPLRPLMRLPRVNEGHADVALDAALSCQVALEYLLKGPEASGAQATAEIKAKLSDEHVKVGVYVSTAWLNCFLVAFDARCVVLVLYTAVRFGQVGLSFVPLCICGIML